MTIIRTKFTKKAFEDILKANDNSAKFVIAVDLGDLTSCCGINDLNEIADEYVPDRYILSGISYKPVGVENDSVLIEVESESVETY